MKGTAASETEKKKGKREFCDFYIANLNKIWSYVERFLSAFTHILCRSRSLPTQQYDVL